MTTKFMAYRDLVRGMSPADRALLAVACCEESRVSVKGTEAEYKWNGAITAIHIAARYSAKEG